MQQELPRHDSPPTLVALERCDSYDTDEVFDAVKSAVDALGGIERFVRPGQSVLIKPNLLLASDPSRPIDTHPAVVDAVVRLVKQAGGAPGIGDSPGLGSLARVAERAGIAEVARRHGVPLVSFEDSVPVEPAEDQLFREIELARSVVEADVVINVPKVKTHGQMLLTMAVKNLFGCVAGRRKAMWHLRAGRDHELFARLLVEVCRATQAALHIADGIVGMHGNGPRSGDPIALGLIAAGADPVALDSVLCRILGVEPLRHLTTRIGAELGLGVADADRIEVRGHDLEALRPDGFRLPPTEPLGLGPAWLVRFMRRRFRPRPVIDAARCKRCGVCIKACPAETIRETDQQVHIEYRDCISCFCCQELCPHGAIEVQQHWLAKRIFR